MSQRNKFPARTRALTAAHQPALSRRTFVTGLAATGLLGGINWRTGRAQTPGASATGPAIISGNRFDLSIGYREVNFTGTPRLATVVNGGLPVPCCVGRKVRGGAARYKQPRCRQFHTLARHYFAGRHGRCSGVQFSGHPARRKLRVPVSGPAERHLLVPQPFRLPGTNRFVWRDCHRPCRTRAVSLRPRLRGDVV